MPNGQLAWITPISGSPGSPDNELPGGPSRPSRPPISIPPTPPGVIAPPIFLPPDGSDPGFPIQIPDRPENPIALPPGTVWPPLNPGDGVGGKALLLAWVVGTGKYRWVVVSVPPLTPDNSLPSGSPAVTPK